MEGHLLFGSNVDQEESNDDNIPFISLLEPKSVIVQRGSLRYINARCSTVLERGLITD